MTETLGERIHRMQVESREKPDFTGVYEIASALGVDPVTVWARYAGWAFVEIERLREDCNALIKTIDKLREALND